MDSTLNLNEAQLEAWCHSALILSKKIGVGSKKANIELKSMLETFGTLQNIYQHYFSMVPLDLELRKKLDVAYNKVKFNFGVISINDDKYPKELLNIEGIPPVYYYRGDVDILKLKRSISFVGTRELDEPLHIMQGKKAINRLSEAGYQVIVSGLAKGSDTLGHKSALAMGMKTIAVLGTPLDIYYPAENKALQEQIATTNLVVSEYPIGIRSQGSYFANRNLTTVSLSYEGVIVARSGDKSGTQHAIKTCIEQGKNLYVLENNIYESEYQWITKYKPFIKVIKDR